MKETMESFTIYSVGKFEGYSKYILILVLFVHSNWPANNETVMQVIPPYLHG